jgi:hypothetical protein
MNEKYYRHIARAEYDLRFQGFLTKLVNIGNLCPRERHLYPLMDSVVFQDLETAMNGVIEDFAKEACNDNTDKSHFVR